MKDSIAVILGAGEGTRMKSDKPKVLHKAAGSALIEWVLDATEDAKKKIVVCGRGMEDIQALLQDKCEYAEQKERLGSGHAVMSAKDNLQGFEGYTFIIAGDMPFITKNTLQEMYAQTKEYDCVLLSAVLEDPRAYGRVIRDDKGNVSEIVEEKDATEAQKQIKEVNASCYCVNNTLLLNALKKIDNNNAQKEYYLTDIVKILHSEGHKVTAYIAKDTKECMGVNDKIQLAEVSSYLQKRILEGHMREGVIITDPNNTYIDKDTKIGKDTVIYPNTVLENGCVIGENTVIYNGSRLNDAKIGSNTNVQNSVILSASVGSNCEVGPNAYIRPKTKVGNNCRVGDFVELKNSVIDDGTKISHLTYVGDADLGKNINLGCGVVFVNYDGKSKFRTKVGDNAFIGCNTNLISPVQVGKDTYIAAGATITHDVPDGAFAIARSRQTVKTDWKDKRKR